jgi:hypothetical protein
MKALLQQRNNMLHRSISGGAHAVQPRHCTFKGLAIGLRRPALRKTHATAQRTLDAAPDGMAD